MRAGVVDLTGHRFGQLTVTEIAYKKARKYFWRCRCDCGNDHVVYGHLLRSGQTTRCRQCFAKSIGDRCRTHGETAKNSKEYRSWRMMHNRCENRRARDHSRYGGRGIAVCDRWRKYENFLADMGRAPTPKHSLHRLHNSVGYAPGNCAWATDTIQANNRRSSRMITVDGITDTVANTCRRLGINPQRIWQWKQLTVLSWQGIFNHARALDAKRTSG